MRKIILITLLWSNVMSLPTPKITLLKPSGVRFSFPDQPGTSLIGLHYSINQKLLGVAAGQFNVDINAKTGNEWVHENSGVTVHPGDTVSYWYLVVKDGQGYQQTAQTWLAQDDHTTRKTTTVVMTTHAPLGEHSTVTTQTPVVTSQANQQVLSSNTNTVSTNSAQCSGQQQQGLGAVTQQCPGGNQHPTCTSYPCLIFYDDFETLNVEVWEHEITAGGGGNWEFQYYTNNRSNSYVRDGILYIKPTLTSDHFGEQFLTQGSLELWGSQPGDVCTGNAFYGCKRDGNPANIINPIQSARLRSSRGFRFKYGKVEVEAKMPTGDWLWPAIWMLPYRNAYGQWPASGEIDIIESRGNMDYVDENGQTQGVNHMGSTLHFGPNFWHNRYETAHGEKTLDDPDIWINDNNYIWKVLQDKKHIGTAASGTFGDSFHKYGVEWDENHIRFTVDDDEVLNVAPAENFWKHGGLDTSGLENPWEGATKMAPFDQEFFLIMNVAVGGVNYFPDTFTNRNYPKPWNNKSPTALKDFWNQHNLWYPTWNPDKNKGEDAAMQVNYIKVWKMKP